MKQGFVTGKRKSICIAAALVLSLILSSCGNTAKEEAPRITSSEPVFLEERTPSAEKAGEKRTRTSRPQTAADTEPESEAAVQAQSVTETDEIQAAEPEEDAGRAEAVGSGRYVYSTLSEEAQTVYDEILRCVLDHDTKISVSTLDKDLLDRAYEAMNADYGGLFWLNGYVYTTYTLGGDVTELEFAPKYTMDYDERVAVQRSIDVSVEQMLSGISLTDTDYDKAKYVFETLIDQVDYDLDAPENQNIVSVFIYRRTVCQGYACATQYLLQQLGVESFIVTGRANGENHAWNILKLDGSYYYIDTTWGNSQFSAADNSQGKFMNYAYLNVTTEEIGRTHTADVSFFLPKCSSIEDNYFVKEGLYFNEWLPDEIGELISTGWFSGPVAVSVKFSNRQLMERAISYFVTEQHIADFCPGLTSYSYLNDSSQHVLTISF